MINKALPFEIPIHFQNGTFAIPQQIKQRFRLKIGDKLKLIARKNFLIIEFKP